MTADPPTPRDPWIAERGSRMPSGKYWWLVRNTVTGEIFATNKKWGAECQAEIYNRKAAADHAMPSEVER